jgi:hypothetical protein
MRITYGYIVLAVGLVAFAFGDTRFSGTVVDENGGAISGATIQLHWDPAGSAVGLDSNVGIKRDLALTTDQNGRFAADLPSGFYDLFVSATAFTPACRKIRLKGAATAESGFRLRVDPKVVSELGYRIPPRR